MEREIVGYFGGKMSDRDGWEEWDWIFAM